MIVAALIEYDVDGVTKYLGVTDGEYKDTSGVSLEDGLWHSVLQSDVSWSEQARHPYQEQGGELTVGNLVLANDGTLDFLMDADIVGMKVTLKRGEKDEAFSAMEQVFIARIANRRFEGHSIVIELDNWLAKLSGPVYTETFGSDVPNPQLVGKQIPYVLGKVTQAPVLLYDANNLTYYTAANTSLIGEVAEGGNPTQKWYLNAQPTFDLKGSPTLPITATFEGPSDTAWATVIDDDLNTWVTGADTSLASPYVSQGNRPSGWTLVVGDDGSASITVSQSSGMRINDATPKANVSTTVTPLQGIGSFDGESIQVKSSSVSWNNPQNAETNASINDATISTGSGKTDAIQLSVVGHQGAMPILVAANQNVSAGTIVLDSISIAKDGIDTYLESFDIELTTGSKEVILSKIWETAIPKELTSTTYLRLKLRDDYVGTYGVNELYLTSKYADSPAVHLRRDLGLIDGGVYSVRIEGTTSDAVSLLWGAHNSAAEDWPENSDYVEFINQDGVAKTKSDFVDNSIIEASGSVFNLSYQPAFGASDSAFRNGDVTITRVKITKQFGGNKSYKGLVPHVVTQAGYTTAEVDQTAIDAHADEYGDPELGWLITKNESADQVLFRLAGSLFGYVWHGLDGKVRSKKLEAPSAVADPFTIDSANCDPAQIIAYDDEAPNLRKSVNALRNWQPLSADSTAGITTTWTEADRAKVIADWRITRAWEMGADGKEEFTRRWPNVASREPLSTALRDATTCQLVANQGPDQWIERPMFYEVPVYVPLGQLSKVAVGETVKAELDYPGLEDDWLLVLGRSGGAMEGMVNLTLWSAGTVPVTLLHGDSGRVDPRITFTRNSVAHRWTENKVLEEVAADVLRHSYNFDTGKMEWLFEEARTNELTKSEEFDHADWSKNSASVQEDFSAAPDGVVSADRIVDSDSGVAGYIAQTPATSSSTQYTASVFVKKAFSAVFEIRARTTNVGAQFDDNGNSAWRGAGDNKGIDDAGDYWRFWLTFTTSSTSEEVRFFPAIDSTPADGGVDLSVTDAAVLWGAQLEEGSAPSSYIATTTTAATRAADNALIDGAHFSDLWNDSEGAFVVEVTPDGTSNANIVSANNGTTDERNTVRIASGSYQYGIWDGGASQAGIFASSATVGVAKRLAAAYKTNDVALYEGGASEGADATASMPSPTQLQIGNGSAGQFNGHIANLHYYPQRLTNAQLKAASVVGRDLIREKV